jgi:ATP synthase protein I
MAEDNKLENLQRRIEAAKPAPQTDNKSTSSGVGAAMRLSVELMAGVLVGSAIGYFLDKGFGTKPWLLILCFFLGTAAGFRNMLREAKKLANEDT